MRDSVLRICAIAIMHLLIFSPVTLAWQLNSVQVSNVSHDSAEVSWDTGSMPTEGRVKYGTSTSVSEEVYENTLLTSHNLTLTGLQPSTTYHYTVNATNESGVSKEDPIRTFDTEDPPDTEPPNITSDISLDLPSDSEARLSWSTDEAADSRVAYGTVEHDLSNSTNTSTLTTSHSVTLSGLETGTQYYYRVQSCDEAGNCQQSETQLLIPGKDNSPPHINVSLPEKYGKETITFSGETEPGTVVDLYVDGTQLTHSYAEDGTFSFSSISLAGYGDTVDIELQAEDQVGFTNSKSFTIEVNFQPPRLNITQPPNGSESTIVKGTVDQLCEINFTVSSTEDQTPPDKVTGLHNTSVETNAVTLEWDAVDASDLHEYAIFRNGTLLTTTGGTSFTDKGGLVASGATYSYRVQAVDDVCNKGAKSDPLTVTTVSGGTQDETQEPAEGDYSCSSSSFHESISVQGPFTQGISLDQGTNHISITATNEYGNADSYEDTVEVDTKAPEITDINLGQLSPTYSRVIEVKGEVSEASNIYVYINDEDNPSASTSVDSADNFSVTTELDRNTELKIEEDVQGDNEIETESGAKISEAWENHIKVVAEDEAGLKSEPKEGDIMLTTCSQGAWFDVEVDGITPLLNPRLMLEGMSQIGMNLYIDYVGGNPDDVSLSRVKVQKRPLNLEKQDKWDMQWFKTPQRSGQIVNSTSYRGYVSLNIKKLNGRFEKNLTTLEKEENLSKHRMGEECLKPGFGCVRYPLMVRIHFKDTVKEQEQVQQTCIDVESAIDKRIPPDALPEEFLKNSIAALNATINAIDQVLEPLKTVSTWTMYSCIALMLADWGFEIYKAYKCKFSQLVSKLGSGSFKMSVAQTGLCEEADYCKDSDDPTKDNKCTACKQCQSAIEKSLNFKERRRWACDRMFCPAAPTVQRFVQNSQDKLEGDLEPYKEHNDDPQEFVENAPDEEVPGFGSEGVSPDCAMVEDINNYLKENAAEDSTEGEDVCSETLHVPKKECCKEEYMENWDTSCLMMDEFKESGCLYAKLTDHPQYVDETRPQETECNVVWNAAAGFCSAKGGAQPELPKAEDFWAKPETARPDSPKPDNWDLYFRVTKPQKNTTEEGGDPQAMLVEPGYTTTDVDISARQGGAIKEGDPSVVNSQRKFYPLETDIDFTKFFRQDSKESGGIEINASEGDKFDYHAFCEALNKIACSGDPGSSKRIDEEDLEELDEDHAHWAKQEGDKAESQAEKLKNKMLGYCERIYEEGDSRDLCKEQAKDPDIDEVYPRGSTTISSSEGCKDGDKIECGNEGSTDGPHYQDAKELHERIQDHLLISDKKYVVDPASTLLRSIQCACLPAVRASLEVWHNMLLAVKNCLQMVLVTGEGSTGQCRAIIAEHVCDLLYDAIRCFQERYAATGSRMSGEFSAIGNLAGAVTDGTNQVFKSVRSRYGDNQMFNAMFGSKKLVHSLCQFAFTGEWDYSIQGMLDSAREETPVKSIGVIYPCERRYMSYNQQKDGIAKFNYRIGASISAGADLKYWVQLKCSGGLNCNPQEGFKEGQCDCQAGGEDPETIKTGELSQGEMWDEEILKQLERDKRYDTAILKWQWEGNNGETKTDKKTCEISQAGGTPPAFCQFSPTEGFRCDMNIGDESYAYFTGDPKLKGEKEDLVVDDRPEFTVPVAYKAPQNANEMCNGYICPYTKWVGFELRHAGNTVMENLVKIEREGQDSIPVEGPRDLTEDDLTEGGGYTLDELNQGDNSEDACDSGKNPHCTGQYTADKTTYVFHDTGGAWRQRQVANPSNQHPPVTEHIQKGGDWIASNGTTEDIQVSGLTCAVDAYDSSCQYGFVIVPKDTDEEPCSGGNTEVQMDAVFTIYDSIKQGSGYQADTTTPFTYQDEEQQRELDVIVRCEEEGDSSGTGTPACPKPMLHDWSSYSQLQGKSSCHCSDGYTCERGASGLSYCNGEGICQDQPVQMPACDAAEEDMTEWALLEDEKGWNALPKLECDCGGDTCSKDDNQYCVDGECKEIPACHSVPVSQLDDKSDYYEHDNRQVDECWCSEDETCKSSEDHYCQKSSSSCKTHDPWK